MLNQAIDEIESNQLEAMYSQKNQGISYNFVIPFSDSDPVEINIEAEEADASDTESPDGDNKVGREIGKRISMISSDYPEILQSLKTGLSIFTLIRENLEKSGQKQP